MVSRHSPQYPANVISLQGRTAALARNYKEKPSENALANYITLRQAFLRAKAQHHRDLAKMFDEQALLVDGSDLKKVQ